MSRRLLWLGLVLAATAVLLTVGVVPDSSEESTQMNDSMEEFAQQLREMKAKSEEQARRPLTADEIAKIRSDDELLGRVYMHLEGRTGYGSDLAARAALSPEARALVATTEFEDDSYNGGIAQYVMNHADDIDRALAEIIQGYETIGIPSMTQLATDVLAVVRKEAALRDRLTSTMGRDDAFTAYLTRSELNDLDDRLEDTEPARIAFIRRNPGAFADP